MASKVSIYDLASVPSDFKHVAGAAVAGAVIIVVGLLVKRKLSRQHEDVLPTGRWTLLNSAVEIVKIFRSLVNGMIGPHSEAYVGVIFTTFIFILISNLSGMIPGFLSPTENINNNFAVAIFIFVTYQILGFKEHGFGYLKQFTGGLPTPGFGFVMTLILGVIASLVLVIELIGHVVRPFSLSLRLWGTINGDHQLLYVFSGLIPLFIPILAMCLGLLVSVVQALVFALLSTVYIKLAVSHDH
jgi:F-type H+-transporting ATPase subunit a